MCVKLGIPYAEYHRTVGPANKHFHEIAETMLLNREGVLPLDGGDDESEGMAPPDDVDGVGDHDAPDVSDIATHGSPAKK